MTLVPRRSGPIRAVLVPWLALLALPFLPLVGTSAGRNAAHFIGCFWKKSHIRSLADTFLVDLPSTFSGGSRPGDDRGGGCRTTL